MALTEHRRRGDVLLLRLFDRIAHGAIGHGVAKAPMPVDNRRRGGFLGDDPGRLRDDMADLNAFDILRDQDDAVGVMPHEVGTDVVARDDRGLLLGRAGADQQALGDLDQAFR